MTCKNCGVTVIPGQQCTVCGLVAPKDDRYRYERKKRQAKNEKYLGIKKGHKILGCIALVAGFLAFLATIFGVRWHNNFLFFAAIFFFMAAINYLKPTFAITWIYYHYDDRAFIYDDHAFIFDRELEKGWFKKTTHIGFIVCFTLGIVLTATPRTLFDSLMKLLASL